MNFLIAGRRSGKTTFLVKQMRESPNSVCIVPNMTMWILMERAYPDLAGRFISLSDIRDGALRGIDHGTEVFIDNLDMMLLSLLNTSNPITLVTATDDSIGDGM